MSRSELSPLLTCMVSVSPGCAMALPGIVAVWSPTWSFQPVRMIGSTVVFFRLIQGVASARVASVISTRATGTAGLGLAAARGDADAAGTFRGSWVGLTVVGFGAGVAAPQAVRTNSAVTKVSAVAARKVDGGLESGDPSNASNTP